MRKNTHFCFQSSYPHSLLNVSSCHPQPETRTKGSKRTFADGGCEVMENGDLTGSHSAQEVCLILMSGWATKMEGALSERLSSDEMPRSSPARLSRVGPETTGTCTSPGGQALLGSWDCPSRNLVAPAGHEWLCCTHSVCEEYPKQAARATGARVNLYCHGWTLRKSTMRPMSPGGGLHRWVGDVYLYHLAQPLPALAVGANPFLPSSARPLQMRTPGKTASPISSSQPSGLGQTGSSAATKHMWG